MNKATFWDVGKHPAKPTALEIDGVLRWERRPRTLRWAVLDKAGNIRELPLNNGTAHTNPDNPYGLHIRREKISKGMLPLNECPLSRREYKIHMPAELQQGTPCVSGGFSRTNPCPHMQALMEHRRAEHAKKEAIRAERYRSQESKDRELDREKQDEQTKAVVDAMQLLAQLAANGVQLPQATAEIAEDEPAKKTKSKKKDSAES